MSVSPSVPDIPFHVLSLYRAVVSVRTSLLKTARELCYEVETVRVSSGLIMWAGAV